LSEFAVLNVLLLSLAIIALILMQALIGGTRLLFSIPGYTVLALAACLSVFRWRRPLTPMNPWCLASTTLFFAYILWRALDSPIPYLAWPDLLTVLGALTVYLLFALPLAKPRYRLAFSMALFALAIVNVGIGIVQFAKDENFMPIGFLQRPDYGSRASGLYICPNHLAGFLHVTALFALSIAVWSRWRAPAKLLAFYVAGLSLAELMMTGSRGGYLSMAGGLAVFVVLSLVAARQAFSGRFLPVAIGTILLLAAIGTGVKVFMNHSELVRQRTENVIDMNNMRLVLWKAALEQFWLSPAVGTGSGTYLYYGRRFRPSNIDNDPIRAHNDYLELLAEYGSVGGAGFLIFLVAHLSNGWKNFQLIIRNRLMVHGRLQSDVLALNIAAGSAVAAYAIHSVVDFNLHIPANALIVAFVFAILANPGAGISQEVSPGWPSRLAYYSLPGLAVWVIFMGLPKLKGEYLTERARTSMRDGNYHMAIQMAQRAILSEPDNPNPYYFLGWGRFAMAADPALHPMAAKILMRKSAEAYKKGLEIFPQDTRMLLDYADASRMSGNWDQAQWGYREAMHWDPLSAWNRARYAMALREKGLIEEAKAEFEKSIALKSTPLAQKGLKEVIAEMNGRKSAAEAGTHLQK
jgi:O-antigen ligase